MLASLLLCLPADDPAWVYPLDVAVGAGRTVVADRRWPGLWEVKAGKLEELFQASDRFKTPLNAVRCVAVGPDGTVYAGDSGSRQVYRMGDEGPVPLAGEIGKDGNVGVGIAMDIAVTDDGLLVSDIELHRIVRIPFEGGPPVDVADVRAPRGVFWDGERLLVVSHGENALLSITAEGETDVLVEGQPFDFAHEVAPLGGSLYVTDGYADGVWTVSMDGEVGEKLQAEGMENPVGIAPDGERLLIMDPRTPGLWQLRDGAITRAEP